MGSGSSGDEADGSLVSAAEREMRTIHNRTLIEYFARLGQSEKDNECINLEYIESLLNSGAAINCTDKYGQTVLHEVRGSDIYLFLRKNKHLV